MEYLKELNIKLSKSRRKKKLAFYVGYARLFHMFYERLDKGIIQCLVYFISVSAENHMEQIDMDSEIKDMAKLFNEDMRTFMYWHEHDILNPGQAKKFSVWLKEKEQYIAELDKLFICLAYIWFCLPACMVPEKYTDEQVMYIILEFIGKHADYTYMDNMFIMALFEEFVQKGMTTKV